MGRRVGKHIRLVQREWSVNSRSRITVLGAILTLDYRFTGGQRPKSFLTKSHRPGGGRPDVVSPDLDL